MNQRYVHKMISYYGEIRQPETTESPPQHFADNTDEEE